MRVLVTGASGFLGSHIAEHLVKSGNSVRLLLRDTSSREFLRFPHEEAAGDVTDPASLVTALDGVDGVVHSAGLIKARNEEEFVAVNDTGTANLVAAASALSSGLTRFVYISSLAARGPGDGSEPTAPVTSYGRTKLAGEAHLQASTLSDRSTIFRMPVIYGPRDPALVPMFWGARLRVAPMLSGGRNRISIIYATDAAAAVGAALSAESDGLKTYTPEDGEAHSWRDLLGAIETAVGHNVFALPVPKLAYQLAALGSASFGRIANRAVIFTPEKVQEMAQDAWVCSSADLTKDLGWSARVKIADGAASTYDWYRANRWL